MAYELVQVGLAQYSIDWTVIRRLVRAHYLAKYELSYGNEVTLSDSHWYNPFSWSLPDVSHVEVDWETVRKCTDMDTDSTMDELRERMKYNPADVGYRVERMIEETAIDKEQFLDWMGTVQTQNMQNINKAVGDYESDIEIAKWVRDTSADGLMVGASVMSGGAAVAVMGGGSFFKGAWKFQDTGSVGAGVMEGAGSFVFAYVKLGKTFSLKQDMVLAIVQSGWKTGTELVGGASVAKAVASGALKLTGPGVDRLFKVGPAKSLFDKVAVPIVITYDGKNVASKFLSKTAAMLVQKRLIEGAGKGPLTRLIDPPAMDDNTASESSRRQGQVIAEATLSNKYLLYLALVNMANGIGRGW